MRGLWLEAGTLRLRDDLPAPGPPPGEARIRVLRAGVCGTDLELLRGYYPFAGVPGHEFVGVVEEAPGYEAWRGRRVVGEINAACGGCETCRAGRRTHCERRSVLGIRSRHGACAERLLLPVANLHEVPVAIPDAAAVFVEPLAAALQVQEQVGVGPGQRVVIVGAGRLGDLLAQTLALTGCDLLVAARRAESLARFRARGHATALASELPAGRADVVVECTGNPEGFELARRALRPRGTLVLKSTYAGRASVDLSALVVGELTLVGSRCGPFPKAIELLARGAVDVLSLLEASYPLAQAVAAFERAAQPGVLKVQVVCGSGEA